MLPFAEALCVSAPSPLQDGLVRHCGGIRSGAEDQPTQCPVSHCQRRRPSGSHTQDQVLAVPKTCSPAASARFPLLMPRACASQVGARQPDVPVSRAPDGPAAAQCRLLRHGGTAAGLLGRPQADHRPVHQSAEGRVSAFPLHFPLGGGSLSTLNSF